MKRAQTIIFVLTVLLSSGCNQSQSNSEVHSVQAAWDSFKEASLSSKGEIAAERVTRQTHGYYAEIRDAALNSTRDELQQKTLARQVTVLGMRVRVPRTQLESMSGRDLFIHAINQGWIGKSSASDEEITNIAVTGDHARANTTKAGQTTDQLVHFIKEDGVWRLDMMPMILLANAAFDAMQKESGLGEEEFVSRLIETVTSKRLTDADWNPLIIDQGGDGPTAN